MRWVDIELGELDTVPGENKSPHDGSCIYVFWLGFPNMYKIGTSGRWEQRLKSLKSANPFIKPAIVIVDSGHLEKKIHKSLAEYKYETDGSNEIFVFDNERHVVEFVKKLASEYTVVYLDEVFKHRIAESKYE